MEKLNEVVYPNSEFLVTYEIGEHFHPREMQVYSSVGNLVLNWQNNYPDYKNLQRNPEFNEFISQRGLGLNVTRKAKKPPHSETVFSLPSLMDQQWPSEIVKINCTDNRQTFNLEWQRNSTDAFGKFIVWGSQEDTIIEVAKKIEPTIELDLLYADIEKMYNDLK